ncbi:FkbM family methyltransferase [Helicobacter salomonis]|uniref:FkbM family methyltransferase n=1 Tax=Helicobacter salomonis TaxID=56878 RepID=UPI000CF161FF|nr:FkbM family methyltransferase [Helicobacter salomonis]
MRTLDSLIQECGFTPNFIKIDTDGFDFKIIRGAEQTLQKFKPALFFEWDHTCLSAQGEVSTGIFPLLNKFGYEQLIIFDNYGNLVCTLSSKDILNLSLLMDYTRYSQQNLVPFFDVLAIHKDSLFCFEDYKKIYDSQALTSQAF